MPEPMKTCTYCGATGYPDAVDRRECCAGFTSPKNAHEVAPPEVFKSYAEEWLSDLNSCEILVVPGVAELLLEHFNNKIIEAFDEDHNAAEWDEDEDEDEDNPPYDDTRRKQNFGQDDRDPMHSGA